MGKWDNVSSSRLSGGEGGREGGGERSFLRIIPGPFYPPHRRGGKAAGERGSSARRARRRRRRWAVGDGRHIIGAIRAMRDSTIAKSGVPPLAGSGGIERCAREFRRVSGTSCIVYLAPFTRLLAGIDYLAITVFRIVRGHSCLSLSSPFHLFSLR